MTESAHNADHHGPKPPKSRLIGNIVVLILVVVIICLSWFVKYPNEGTPEPYEALSLATAFLYVFVALPSIGDILAFNSYSVLTQGYYVMGFAFIVGTLFSYHDPMSTRTPTYELLSMNFTISTLKYVAGTIVATSGLIGRSTITQITVVSSGYLLFMFCTQLVLKTLITSGQQHYNIDLILDPGSVFLVRMAAGGFSLCSTLVAPAVSNKVFGKSWKAQGKFTRSGKRIFNDRRPSFSFLAALFSWFTLPVFTALGVAGSTTTADNFSASVVRTIVSTITGILCCVGVQGLRGGGKLRFFDVTTTATISGAVGACSIANILIIGNSAEHTPDLFYFGLIGMVCGTVSGLVSEVLSRVFESINNTKQGGIGAFDDVSGVLWAHLIPGVISFSCTCVISSTGTSSSFAGTGFTTNGIFIAVFGIIILICGMALGCIFGAIAGLTDPLAPSELYDDDATIELPKLREDFNISDQYGMLEKHIVKMDKKALDAVIPHPVAEVAHEVPSSNVTSAFDGRDDSSSIKEMVSSTRPTSGPEDDLDSSSNP